METNKLNGEVNIGGKILEVLKERNMTRAQLARVAGITPASVSYLMTRKTIDVMSLVRVSRVLKHNFLKYYYVEEEEVPASAKPKEGKDEKDIQIEGLKEKIIALEKEIDRLKREQVIQENEYLRKINALLERMK
jgi:transcriptional regulator with XRE-family HTH domain